MPQHYGKMSKNVIKKKSLKKTTSESLPGSGMAKTAGRAIEQRKTRMQKLLKNL